MAPSESWVNLMIGDETVILVGKFSYSYTFLFLSDDEQTTECYEYVMDIIKLNVM